MAVLAEVISVIVRIQAINDHFPGGWAAFVQAVPNKTLCSDNELARVGFMTTEDSEIFIRTLERDGLAFVSDGKSKDIAAVDQIRGFTVPCDWAEFARVEIRPGQVVSAVHLKGSINRQVVCPGYWNYQGSLSEQFIRVPSKEIHKSLKLLRRENNLETYLNMLDGEEVYIGRINDDPCRDRAEGKAVIGRLVPLAVLIALFLTLLGFAY